jgi:hypothetical protein
LRSGGWAFTGTLDARRLYIVAGIIVGPALVAALVVLLVLFWPSGGGPSGPRAAIVDQLALTDPNDQFVADATRELTDAGYAVDYFAGDEVNVDLYRRLPSLGYGFVLLRSHSAWDRTEVEIQRLAPASLMARWGSFTNELYSTQTHSTISTRRASASARTYSSTSPSDTSSSARSSSRTELAASSRAPWC